MLPHPSSIFYDYVTGYYPITNLSFLLEESSIALSAIMLIAKTSLPIIVLENEASHNK